MMKMKSLKIIIGSVLGVFVVGGAVAANIPTVKIEEVIESIHFKTNTTYDETIRNGVAEVKQEGKDGSKNVTYEVTYKNGKEVDRKKQRETVLEASVDKEVVVGTKKYYVCSDGTEYDDLNAKNECDKKVAWEKQKNAELQECNDDSSKTNCWYDEYPGTTLHWTEYKAPSTYTPAPGPANNRKGAICKDGTRSSATGRGACSHHGGVARWI